MYICICTYTYVYTYMNINMHLYIKTYIQTNHTYMYILMHMYEFMAVLLLLSYLKSQVIRQNLIRFNINLIYYMDFSSVSFNQCK